MRKMTKGAGVGAFLTTMFLLIVISAGAEYEQGKNIYENKCAFCHGIKGEGNGPAAAALNSPPSNFKSPGFWEENRDSSIIDTIKKGRGMMPAFDLSPDEIKAVIDYMADAFKKE